MKVMLVQSSLAWGNVDANLESFGRKLSSPAAADVILLPEMFTSGCMMVKKSREVAHAARVEVARRFPEVEACMLEWARQQDAVVLGSTVYEQEGGYYNRMIVAFPGGNCLYYDKRHCFRMGGENEYFRAGNRSLVFDFRGCRIAVFICYDLRFPVWSRNVQGYDLAVYVANWPESRREVWNILLKARAIENQAYVAAVNCVGTDANGLRYAGDSMVVDAKGQVVAAAPEFQEKMVLAECDVEELQGFRKRFAVLEDRDTFLMC